MIFSLLILLVAITLDLCSCSAVIELDDADFKSRISDYETALVMFYALSCGDCRLLKRQFDAASDELAKNDPPVQMVKVDCTEGGKETCGSFRVSSYPTLKIFKNGNVRPGDYSGPRDVPGMVKYMARQAGPSFVQINSKESYEKFLTDKDGNDFENRVVGFFSDSSSMKRAFIQAADTLREKFRFGITSVRELLKENNDKDGIVLFRPKQLQTVFEPHQLKYEGSPTSSAIESWLKSNLHGLVDPRTHQNHHDFERPLVVAYYSVDFKKNAKNTNYWRHRIMKVAKGFADDFNFAISAKELSRHEIEFEFDREYPTSEEPIVLVRDEKNRKFIMSEEFSLENFESFLRKLKNNEVEPYARSEPIPKDNSKPVKIAVGKTFDETVINNNKDTFLKLCVSWYGHCQKLSPIWDELGEKMKDENIEIVKINAENNEVPEAYDLEGMPTIYWAPKDRKTSPIQYKGEPALKDFIEFIASHATHELKNYDRKGRPVRETDEL